MEGERHLSCKRCEFTPGVRGWGVLWAPWVFSKGQVPSFKSSIKNITTL